VLAGLVGVVVVSTGATRYASHSGKGSLAAPATAPSGRSTDSTLCLSEGRLLVDATWMKLDGSSGIAHAVALTADSGYFWFLEPGNVELAVKTLNGCSVNGFGAG
jgi:hypothetical protein